jgi:hypothetical protein
MARTSSPVLCSCSPVGTSRPSASALPAWASQGVVAQATGQEVQRLRQAAKDEDADQQRHQHSCRSDQAGTLPDPAQAELPGHLLAGLPVEHDVQVARRPCVTGARREHCGAEDARDSRAHRVGATQRQRSAGQEVAHGLQVHLLLPHHAGIADVGFDAAVGIEDIDLDAWVDHHQHRQHCRARSAVGLIGVGEGDFGPVFDDVPGQSMGQPLQRFLLVLRRDVPAEQPTSAP